MKIEANRMVFSKNLGKFFFPKVFGCVEFSEEMTLQKSGKDLPVIQRNKNANISLGPDQVVAAIFVEKLTLSLAQVIKDTRKRKKRFLDHERFNLLYQAVKGLEIMDEYFLNCAIKPGNMMLKKVTEDEIKEMEEAGVSPARLSLREHFQLKFVEFGLISAGAKGQRECMVGTAGFLPDEFFHENSTDEKLDVYSLGMSFLDLELAERGLGSFSQVDSFLYEKKKKNELQLSSSEIWNLNNFKLFNEMKKLMVDKKLKPIFLQRLAKNFPAFKEKIDNDENSGRYEDLNPLLYLKTDVHTFRNMMVTAIGVYFDKFSKKEKKVPVVKDLNQQIEYLEKKIERAKNANIDTKSLERLKQYYVSKKSLLQANKDLVKQMGLLFLNMISMEEKKRPGVTEVVSIVHNLKSNFDNLTKQDIKEIYSYEDKASKKKLTHSSMFGKKIPRKIFMSREIKKPVQDKDQQEINLKNLTNEQIKRHLIML